MGRTASQATATRYKAAALAAARSATSSARRRLTSGAEHSARSRPRAGVAGLEAIGRHPTGCGRHRLRRAGRRTRGDPHAGGTPAGPPGVADVTGVGGHARTASAGTAGQHRPRRNMADFDNRDHLRLSARGVGHRRADRCVGPGRAGAPGRGRRHTASGPLGRTWPARCRARRRAREPRRPRRSRRPAAPDTSPSAAYARCVVAVIRRVVADDEYACPPADDVVGPMLGSRRPPPVDSACARAETIPEGHLGMTRSRPRGSLGPAGMTRPGVEGSPCPCRRPRSPSPSSRRSSPAVRRRGREPSRRDRRGALPVRCGSPHEIGHHSSLLRCGSSAARTPPTFAVVAVAAPFPPTTTRAGGTRGSRHGRWSRRGCWARRTPGPTTETGVPCTSQRRRIGRSELRSSVSLDPVLRSSQRRTS